jgi:hypothetical protein
MLRVRQRLLAVAALGVVACTATDAAAAVTLSITDSSGPPAQGTATRGGSFFVSVFLNSTGEQTSGLDYKLQVSNNGSGLFRIIDRNLSTSPYSERTAPDSAVESATAPASALLDPDNDINLGASQPFGDAAVGAGSTLVAIFEIGVSASAPLQTFTLTTFNDSGTPGYAGPPPQYTPGTFASHVPYQVTVVPEPSGMLAAALGAGLFTLRRRRSASVR